MRDTMYNMRICVIITTVIVLRGLSTFFYTYQQNLQLLLRPVIIRCFVPF